MRYVVKESLDVQIDNPGTSPTPLFTYLHRVQRRLTRTIAIGIGVKDRLHVRFQDHSHYRLRYPISDGGHGHCIGPPWPSSLWVLWWSRIRSIRWWDNTCRSCSP